jgi:hypothetical protein
MPWVVDTCPVNDALNDDPDYGRASALLARYPGGAQGLGALRDIARGAADGYAFMRTTVELPAIVTMKRPNGGWMTRKTTSPCAA